MKEIIMMMVAYTLIWVACDVPKESGFMKDRYWWLKFVLVTIAGMIFMNIN